MSRAAGTGMPDMHSAGRWLLPDGVEDLLPGDAAKLEFLRRRILDLYATWGYRLIIPPLVEYLDSLLTGSGGDLDLHTFKLTDQLSGRLLGLRADITPQAARIDAHGLGHDAPTRLCYADSVLHTRPRGLLSSRIPLRIGAELFGHAGSACDIELICLMHTTLQTVAINDVTVVLGHVGIFRSFAEAANLPPETESELFEAVQRKAPHDIERIARQAVADEFLAEWLCQLTRLSGGERALTTARRLFNAAQAPQACRDALAELEVVAAGVKARLPNIRLGFDLCELRGYAYHTGIVFAAYTPAYGRAVAKGGRYDHIGEAFGRARPASGFDSDLKTLARLSPCSPPTRRPILAPDFATDKPDTALLKLIGDLRAKGETVISDLGDPSHPRPQSDHVSIGDQVDRYERRIVKKRGNWTVEAWSNL